MSGRDWDNGLLIRFALLTPEADYAERPASASYRAVPQLLIDDLRRLHDRLKGIYGRMHVQALKLTSLFAALDWLESDAPTPTVSLDHWSAAQRIAEGWRMSAHRLLEQIGFARATFKANGCPTTHYRLEADAFINRLAAFLEVTPVQVCLWMMTEASPSQVATSATSNGSAAAFSTGANRPVEMAQTAKSVTDSDKQESTQERHTTTQHQTVAVEPDNQARIQSLLDALVQMGIGPTRARALVAGYSTDQINHALRLTERAQPTNPAGYLIRALEGNWQTGLLPKADKTASGVFAFTDRYADFIHS